MADDQRDRESADGGREIPEAERTLMEAARNGRLADHLDAEPEHGGAAVYSMISALIFQRLTRPAELRRGHFGCAAGPGRLEPDCHDKHQDNVAAVRADLLRHADLRFENLPGWLASRLKPVTIDAHRRRRGERGALQRPRLPGWLAAELGEDAWRRQLAVNILDWVGVTATAGHLLWPLRAWAAQRARTVAGPEFSEARMAVEVEHVLAAMRKRPKWYADSVDRPLGRKPAPLAPYSHLHSHGFREEEYVRYTEPDEADHALLTELASAAIEAIADRLADGAPARETVAEVLGLVFGAGTGAEELDRVPDGGRNPGPRERAAQLILDQEVLDRVVAEVLHVIAQDQP